MGFFGIDHTDLDRLKSELQQNISSLQVEVGGLRVEVQQKATDSEETARTAAKNALDSEEQIKATRSRVDDALTTLESVRDKAKEESQKIQDERTRLETNNSELLSQVDTTKKLCASTLELKDSITSSVEDISRKIEKLNTLVTDSQRLADDVSNIEKLLEETKGLGDSMQDLLSHSLKRKAEIDELHKKILGYELEGNEGKVEHIDGIRDELEKAYKRIENKAGELGGRFRSWLMRSPGITKVSWSSKEKFSKNWFRIRKRDTRA